MISESDQHKSTENELLCSVVLNGWNEYQDFMRLFWHVYKVKILCLEKKISFWLLLSRDYMNTWTLHQIEFNTSYLEAQGRASLISLDLRTYKRTYHLFYYIF